MDFRVWAPSELATAWMAGKIHNLPPMWERNLSAAHRAQRKQAFFTACITGDPEVVIWPEFMEGLKRCHLVDRYEKGTISTEMAGLFVARRNRSFGKWHKRAKELRRKGKDPMKRRRFVRSECEFYEVLKLVRKLAERRRFEMTAMRATAIE